MMTQMHGFIMLHYIYNIYIACLSLLLFRGLLMLENILHHVFVQHMFVCRRGFGRAV